LIAARAAIGSAALAIIALAALHVVKPDIHPTRTMIAVMLIVGPGKAPIPKGPERFLGAPNRLFMVA
jgi:hypothetical protein